jgi:hypothetical protein
VKNLSIRDEKQENTHATREFVIFPRLLICQIWSAILFPGKLGEKTSYAESKCLMFVGEIFSANTIQSDLIANALSGVWKNGRKWAKVLMISADGDNEADGKMIWLSMLGKIWRVKPNFASFRGILEQVRWNQVLQFYVWKLLKFLFSRIHYSNELKCIAAHEGVRLFPSISPQRLLKRSVYFHSISNEFISKNSVTLEKNSSSFIIPLITMTSSAWMKLKAFSNSKTSLETSLPRFQFSQVFSSVIPLNFE